MHFAICLGTMRSFKGWFSCSSCVGGLWSMLHLRGCPCLKAWVLLSSLGCSLLQRLRSWLPALQAADIPRISRSGFLQRSGCYAALFISGMWHCLLAELYTWMGQPAVLEKGAGLPNVSPCFQLGKYRVRSARNPHFLVGLDLQQGFYLTGDYKLNSMELGFWSEGHAWYEGGWWTALSWALLLCQQGGAPLGLAGVVQRGCCDWALVEVAWCKCLSQKAINSARKIYIYDFFFLIFFFFFFFSFQNIVLVNITTAQEKFLLHDFSCVPDFGCHLKDRHPWEV